MKSGIYKIAINNKVYVGSTQDFVRRESTHRQKLKSNKHCNKILQHAFNKYGDITFSILEECDVSLLEKRENHWFDVFDCHNRDKGYNIGPAGDGGFRGHMSEEAKERVREFQRARMLGDGNPTKGKPRSQRVKDQVSKVRKEKGLSKGANNPKWKGVEDETLIEAYSRLGSYAAVGREVGLTKSQVRQRILKYKGEWL